MSAPDSKPPKTMPLRPAHAPAGDDGPMLIVVEGLEPGRRFALRGDATTVGRGGDNHVVLPSPAVSAQHARIVARDGQYWIEDLDSTNGVALNGSRIPAGAPRVLAHGDSLRVSDHLLFFHRGEQRQDDPTAEVAVDQVAAAKQAEELIAQLRARS